MKKHRQSGQAMTETIIAASFVLIPLFLLIPLLGKYIDIRHTTIQAARYEAWEYTVWYRDNNKRTLMNPNAEQPNGVKDEHNNDVPLPTKGYAELQKEARQRFFSAAAYDRNKTLTANDHNHWDIAETNPLWRTHRQDPANPANSLPILTSTASIESKNFESSARTPNSLLTLPLDIAYTVIDFIFTAIGSIISFISPNAPTFDAINLNGYSKTTVEVTMARPDDILGFGTLSGTHEIGKTAPDQSPITFSSKAAVLSDGWNAGGRPHVINEAGGMVITKYLASLLSFPPFKIMQTFLAVPFPELRPCNPPLPHPLDVDNDGSLWLGYLDTEAVHPDRLHHVKNGRVNLDHIGGGPNNQGHQCEYNICNFAYNVPGDPDYRYPNAINEVGFEDECN